MFILPKLFRKPARSRNVKRLEGLPTPEKCKGVASLNTGLIRKSVDVLSDDITALFNRHADGINAIALEVRKQTDILLMIGISDPSAAEASILAQQALHLANVGRGEDISGKKLHLTCDQRIEIVASAMSAAILAESMLKAVLKQNDSLLSQRKQALLQIGF